MFTIRIDYVQLLKMMISKSLILYLRLFYMSEAPIKEQLSYKVVLQKCFYPLD